jgi:hypothetical protein
MIPLDLRPLFSGTIRTFSNTQDNTVGLRLNKVDNPNAIVVMYLESLCIMESDISNFYLNQINCPQ